MRGVTATPAGEFKFFPDRPLFVNPTQCGFPSMPKLTRIFRILKKLLLRVVLPFFMILILAVIAGLGWINSDSGKNWTQAQVNALIPGTLSIGRQNLSLFSPALALDDVTLKDADGKALAGFSRFSVNLAFFPLLKKEVRVTHLALVDPWADLVMADGGLTLVRALVDPNAENDASGDSDKAFSMPVNITCKALSVGKGRITFKMPENDLYLAASGLSITADGDFDVRTGNLDIQVEQIDFKQADMAPHPIQIRLQAQLNGKTLVVPEISLASGKTALKLSAQADDVETGDPDLSGRLTLDADLAELATVLGLDGDYSGAIATTLAVNGKSGNPDADLVVSLTAGRVSGWAADRASLELHLQDRQITIRPVEWKLADGSIVLGGTLDLQDAFPAGFFSSDIRLDQANYDLTLTPAIPRITPWLAPVLSMTGALEGRLSLSGSGIDPETADATLSLALSGKDMLAPGMAHPLQNVGLFLDARLADGNLVLSRLDAVTDDLSLAGKGHFSMADQSLSAAVTLDTEDISRTLAMAGLPSATGAAHVALDADGSLNRPAASITINTRNLAADAYTVGDLTLVARMTPDGRVQVERLGLVNQETEIKGSGRFRLRLDDGDLDPDFDTRLDLDLSRVSLSAFMKTPPVDGIFDGHVQAGGPLTHLAGRLTLAGKNLKQEALSIGDLDAGFRFEKGKLQVDRFFVQNGTSTISLTGTSQLLVPGSLEISADPVVDLSARVRNFDPAMVTPLVKGAFNLDAAFSGRVSDPSGKLALTGTGLDVAGQPLSGITLDARLKDKQIWLDGLTVSIAEDEAISGSGWMDLDTRFSVQVSTPGISLSHIRPLQAKTPAAGTLSLDVRAQGTLDAPSADGRLTLSGIRLGEVDMKDLHLDLSLQDAVASITGDLGFALDARYDLRKGDFGASARFDQTETAPWFQILGQPGLHGTFSGKVSASGNASQPMDAAVQAEFQDLALFFTDHPVVQTDRIAFRLANQTASLPEMTLTLFSDGHLRLSATARMGKEDPADGDLDLSLDARLPLSAAGVFSTDLSDARGAVALSGTASGKIRQPSISAKLDLDRISLMIPVLEQRLHNLGGSIRVTDSDIVVDAVKGWLDSGSFEMGGKIRHAFFTPLDVNLTLGAKALPIEVPDTLNALINTNIRVTGKNGAATVRGNIVLLEGSYYKDMKLNFLKMATTRQRAVSPASPPARLPWFDTVALNVEVSHREPFLVENNLASMEINPDLKIGGTLSLPVVSGRARITNGTVYFQKKPFAIKKGIIDFVNPYKTVPEINIESTTVIRQRTITLTLEGPPDNLRLKLSSVPEETDSDILSLILFGRTASELTSGEGGSQQSTAQMMAEMITDTFGDDIKKRTGIDILEVAADGGTESETDMKVTVGKNLSRRVTVKYAVESKNGNMIQRAIAEYKLLENFLVSGFQDTEGVYGTELVFRVEFR